MANCLNGRIDSTIHTHTHNYQVKKKNFQDTVLSVFKDRKFLIPILLKPGLENFEHYFGIVCCRCKSLQSCPTLGDPIDGSPSGSSVHGIFQARVLEWGAIAFSSFSFEKLVYTINSLT